MGMIDLPEPPYDAGPSCLAFYSELRRMLAEVSPIKISKSKSSVEFSKQNLEVWLVHAENDDWALGVNMSESDAIVSIDPAHEHFSADDRGTNDRPWTSQMVDCIAEALRGE